MATVVGKTSTKIDELLGPFIVQLEIVNGRLIATTKDGAQTDIGSVSGGGGGGTIPLGQGGTGVQASSNWNLLEQLGAVKPKTILYNIALNANVWSQSLNHGCSTLVPTVDFLRASDLVPISLEYRVIDDDVIQFRSSIYLPENHFYVSVKG